MKLKMPSMWPTLIFVLLGLMFVVNAFFIYHAVNGRDPVVQSYETVVER